HLDAELAEHRLGDLRRLRTGAGARDADLERHGAARVFAAREAGLLHVLLRQRQVARDLLGVVELLGRRAAAGLLIAGEVRWDEAPRGRALGRAAARQDESLA